MNSKEYKIAIIGPTGGGKSQLCNFILQDKTNSTFKVGNSMNSCTFEPKSIKLKRNNINLELIDSAGNSDSNNNDIENLKKFVKYLVLKKEIDYIILVLKFGERLTGETKQFIETLSNIFAPYEFFSHLSVIFTKCPTKPRKKDIELQRTFTQEIKKNLEEIFKIDKRYKETLSKASKSAEIQAFFVDTELIEDETNGEEEFDLQSQKTIDVILDLILYKYKYFITPIKTEKLDFKESAIKMRREAEINQLEKEIKNAEETLKNQKEEIKENKKKLNEMEKDYNRLNRKLQEVKSLNLGNIFIRIVCAPVTLGYSLFAEDFP